MGGGLYTEQASKGSLYSESDTFNYKSTAGGTASQSINVIGSIGRGGVTEIVIDDAGTGYSVNDQVVFVNTGTEGNNVEAGRNTLSKSGISLITSDSLADAAKKVVSHAAA